VSGAVSSVVVARLRPRVGRVKGPPTGYEGGYSVGGQYASFQGASRWRNRRIGRPCRRPTTRSDRLASCGAGSFGYFAGSLSVR
jgi:hypothetical protein